MGTRVPDSITHSPTHPVTQLGIGEALLAANVEDLQQRAFAMLSLTVTEANRGAVDLYKRLGYSVERVFDAFVWEG